MAEPCRDRNAVLQFVFNEFVTDPAVVGLETDPSASRNVGYPVERRNDSWLALVEQYSDDRKMETHEDFTDFPVNWTVNPEDLFLHRRVLGSHWSPQRTASDTCLGSHLVGLAPLTPEPRTFTPGWGITHQS